VCSDTTLLSDFSKLAVPMTPADQRRNFSLDGQTVALIKSLRQITQAPTESEVVRQCIILLSIMNRYFRSGYSIVIVYDTGQEETITGTLSEVIIDPGKTMPLALNSTTRIKQNFGMTIDTNNIVKNLRSSTEFRSDSQLLRHSVRLYYVLSNAMSSGMVFLRDGLETGIQIILPILPLYIEPPTPTNDHEGKTPPRAPRAGNGIPRIFGSPHDLSKTAR
jgi:hypothetical protein